ncbi:potassium channel family protein [Aliicoccus persicus]|uniref:Trk system potassium uptake protein TrkA n=1 Tax=Aliicoccus persicus TaxID=930138 RepID=A0A662Z122_9STAP|nr:TrkA family potassium uptake protein [Aliicoccus persicus]SEV84456.1 trk system potassium uptake protein TrkA [Aliicoccus persicus]
MKKQFVVIGLGRFGSSVADTLLYQGHEVLVIDRDMSKVEPFMSTATLAVQADATDENVLNELGIRNYEHAIVAIGEDIQSSLLVTLLLKEIEVNTVITKAKDDLHGKMLNKIGADRVVYPERDMGERLAHHLDSSNLIEHIRLSREYDIIEIAAPKSFYNKSVQSLMGMTKKKMTIVAIKKGDSVDISPIHDAIIEPKDVLLIVGEKKLLRKLEQET